MDIKEKIAEAEEKAMEVVNFTNIDKEDFEGMWGGRVRIIKAGETIQVPRFKAENYAKHLAEKILIRKGKDAEISEESSIKKGLISDMIGEGEKPVEFKPEDESKPQETEFAGLADIKKGKVEKNK